MGHSPGGNRAHPPDQAGGRPHRGRGPDRVPGVPAGEHHRHPATVLTGIATVGDQLATVNVAGWSYAIEGTSIPWVDQQGMTHYGSWPSCLGGPGNTTRVTFAEVPVTDPGGSTTRQVVWVDCRS
ncbi:MAG: hypothetical protein ACRDOB_06165 [Streptosporangiaceae bacterium]